MEYITIILANKRKTNETDKAFVYSTSGYGGKVFSIARKFVSKRVEGIGLEVNEMTYYPATLYVITKWMYDKIEGELKLMHESNCKIIKP